MHRSHSTKAIFRVAGNTVICLFVHQRRNMAAESETRANLWLLWLGVFYSSMRWRRTRQLCGIMTQTLTTIWRLSSASLLYLFICPFATACPLQRRFIVLQWITPAQRAAQLVTASHPSRSAPSFYGSLIRQSRWTPHPPFYHLSGNERHLYLHPRPSMHCNIWHHIGRDPPPSRKYFFFHATWGGGRLEYKRAEQPMLADQ